MKVTTEKQDNCQVIMTVEIDKKQEEKLLKKAAARISREVKIPGFRPGKAPYNYIVNRFGIEAIREETMDDLTNSIYKKAIDEAQITPYATASLENIEWEPLVLKVSVPTEPVVELGNYREMRLEFEAPEVSDEEVMHQLEHMAERYVSYTTVERPAQLGDKVSVIVAERDVASNEMLLEDHHQDMVLREFDDKEDDDELDLVASIIGLSVGEETKITHTFSEDGYSDAYAGKEIEITIKVTEIKEKEELAFDDEFAALVGDYDSIDDLKQKVKQDLKEQKQREVDADLIDKAMAKLVENAETIKWPPILEEQELDQVVRNHEYRLQQSGMSMDMYLQTQSQTLEEYRETLREEARKSLRNSLVLSKIIELEDVQLNSNELAQQANLMVALSDGTKEAEQAFKSPEGLNVLANSLMLDKARRKVLAIVKGEAEFEESETEETEAKKAEEPVTDEGVEAEATEGEITAEAESEVETTEETA